MTDLSAEPDASRVPASAWVLAWACLAGQLVALAVRGLNQSDGMMVGLSMVVSALVVSWVSAGVLRARTGRLVLVWILFVAQLALGVLTVLGQTSASAALTVLGLATSVAQVVALAVFCRSRYFQLQQARPAQVPEPSIAGLVLVAVVVGALGGLAAPVDGHDPGPHLQVGP